MTLSGRVAAAILLFCFSAAIAEAQNSCNPYAPQEPYCSLTDGLILVDVDIVGSNPITPMLYWQQEVGFDAFNIYRGRLRSLTDANHDGALDAYGTCHYERTTSDRSYELEAPPVGDAFLYIVSGINAAGEGGFGSASSGVARPNAFPCSSDTGRPVIESFDAMTGPGDGHAACDQTQAFKGYLCFNGFPANVFRSFPTLTLTVDFTATRLQARVTDPDSIPGQNDLTSVTAQYVRSNGGGAPVVEFQELADDGGAGVTLVRQYGDYLAACDADPVCPSCQRANYPTTSHDAASLDDTYSFGLAFITNTQILDAPFGIHPGGSAITQVLDCIAASKGVYPWILDRPVGDQIDFGLTVRDHAGHATVAESLPSVTFQRTHFACSGDECACCLMLSADPASECADRQGLAGVPGSGFENGFCVDLL
jgi:hypothetical protein